MKLLFFTLAPIRWATHLGLNAVQHLHSAVPELTVLLVFPVLGTTFWGDYSIYFDYRH